MLNWKSLWLFLDVSAVKSDSVGFKESLLYQEVFKLCSGKKNASHKYLADIFLS